MVSYARLVLSALFYMLTHNSRDCSQEDIFFCHSIHRLVIVARVSQGRSLFHQVNVLFTSWHFNIERNSFMAVMLVRMPSKASPHPKLFHPQHFTVLVPSIGLVILGLLCSQPAHCSHPHCHLHSLLHPNSPLSYLAACCIPILLQHLINALIKLRDCWLQRNF